MQDRIAKKYLCSICRAQYTPDGGACNDCREYILGDIMAKKKTDEEPTVDYQSLLTQETRAGFADLYEQKPIVDEPLVASDYQALLIRELQKRGFSVVLQDEGDYAAMKGGQVLSVRDKTEAATWDKLITVKYPQG